MGLLVAVLVFFRHIRVVAEHEPVKPFSFFLIQKAARFSEAFGQIVMAQVKISAINTTLTGIYLLVILPLFGRGLPFTPTILLITFVAGLIPVLGNLISNTVIVVVSLGISLGTAIASLTFLVLIHKLEYLVNSRIVGSQTSSQAWEILIAVVVGEAAFGIPGVVMAPIVYAFAKNELREKGLV
jgi:predicted PurR-regulated permease PerM